MSDASWFIAVPFDNIYVQLWKCPVEWALKHQEPECINAEHASNPADWINYRSRSTPIHISRLPHFRHAVMRICQHLGKPVPPQFVVTRAHSSSNDVINHVVDRMTYAEYTQLFTQEREGHNEAQYNNNIQAWIRMYVEDPAFIAAHAAFTSAIVLPKRVAPALAFYNPVFLISDGAHRLSFFYAMCALGLIRSGFMMCNVTATDPSALENQVAPAYIWSTRIYTDRDFAVAVSNKRRRSKSNSKSKSNSNSKSNSKSNRNLRATKRMKITHAHAHTTHAKTKRTSNVYTYGISKNKPKRQ